jgi:hypothetical protein
MTRPSRCTIGCSARAGGTRSFSTKTRHAAFLREVLKNEKDPALEIVDEDRGRDDDR